MRRFRVYCENRSLYVEVRAYDSLKAMRRDLKKREGIGFSDAYGAFCSCDVVSFKSGKARKKPIVGTIYILKSVGVGVLTHECTHAALRWAERIGLGEFASTSGWSCHSEERFCWVVGNLASTIGTRLGWGSQE